MKKVTNCYNEIYIGNNIGKILKMSKLNISELRYHLSNKVKYCLKKLKSRMSNSN